MVTTVTVTVWAKKIKLKQYMVVLFVPITGYCGNSSWLGMV